jgi:hypothetical protein
VLAFGAARRRSYFYVALPVAPILACIGWEYATRHRIHPVWFAGLAAFTARLLAEGLAALPAWLTVGRALIRPFV